MNHDETRSGTGGGASFAPALLLQAWLSPAFPVGGFAYSHGLESAAEAGDIANAASLLQWLLDLVEHGSARSDMILIAAAWRAAGALDKPALRAVNELALALAPSRERHLETISQGNAFVLAASAAFPCGALKIYAALAANGAAYPVALGVAAAGHAVPLEDTCQAWGLAFVAALVSAAARLGVVGQTDGQKIIAALMRAVADCARLAARSTLEDLGGAAIRSDIASMRHETQYSRLFRS